MSNLNIKKKLSVKNLSRIKKNIDSYKSLQFSLLKTEIIPISKFIMIELNLKASLKIINYQNNFIGERKLLNLFIVKKNKDCVSFNNFSLKRLEKQFFVLSFLKQIFSLKYFIKGRIYHFFKNGFIVILNGLVCFLPTNNCSYLDFGIGKSNIFFVLFFSENNTNKIILSQRNIYKKIHHTLFRMASRLVGFKKFDGRRNSIG